MRLASTLATLAVAALLSACENGDNISGIDPLSISKIEITPKIDTIFITDSILPRDTIRFVGRIIGINGLDLDGRLIWKTSDSTIAQIDSFGLVRPVAPGTVEVTASAGEEGKSTLVVERAQRAIRISASTRTILVDDPYDAGDTVTFRAQAFNEAGEVVSGATFAWASSDEGIATVGANGLVLGMGLGTAFIRATNTSGDLTDSLAVTVNPFVQSVTVTAPATRFVAGDTVQFTAGAKGPSGEALSGRTYRWTSSNPTLGTIDESTGLMVVTGQGTTRVTARTGFVDNVPVVDVEVLPRVILSLDAGVDFTCGRISLDRAYCWGNDSTSQLGAKRDTVCMDPFGGSRSSSCELDPLRITGNPSYTQVTAGSGHACGLAADGRAYCWGSSEDGQVGDGRLGTRDAPVLVTSAWRFTTLTTGSEHTCGLLASGDAYCWGLDATGQLGNLMKATSTTPIPVDSGAKFKSISAGSDHTCGINTSDQILCWGAGGFGELGIGSADTVEVPRLLNDGRTYKHVSAGEHFTCAVTTAGAGFCWGAGMDGQIGDGASVDVNTPQPVAGGHLFETIEAGSTHACGLTMSDDVVCWGTYNLKDLNGPRPGALGPSPVPLGGGIKFEAITSGRRHSCGVTAAGDGYCWGSNVWGPFGDGLQALWRGDPVLVKKPQ